MLLKDPLNTNVRQQMWMLDATAELVCFEIHIHLYHETDLLILSVRPVKNNKEQRRGPRSRLMLHGSEFTPKMSLFVMITVLF